MTIGLGKTQMGVKAEATRRALGWRFEADRPAPFGLFTIER